MLDNSCFLIKFINRSENNILNLYTNN